MSKKQQSAQTQESTRYDVSVVEKYTDKDGNKKEHWTRIGVAFPHADGKGFSGKLVANPVSGEFVVRLHEPRPDTAE